MAEHKEKKIPLRLKPVYLHLHTTIEGCANVFVKCSREEADQFMENLDFLQEFVEITSLDGGDPEFPLTSVDIEICDKIIENKDCSHNCPTCLPKNKKWCKEDWSSDKHTHTPNPPLKQDGHLFYYKETDLFGSLILYTIYDLVKKIKESNTKIKIINGDAEVTKRANIDLIVLEIDEKEVMSIDVPSLRIEEFKYNWDPQGMTWVEPAKDRDSLEWLRVINDLIKIVELVEESESKSKMLIFSVE